MSCSTLTDLYAWFAVEEAVVGGTEGERAAPDMTTRKFQNMERKPTRHHGIHDTLTSNPKNLAVTEELWKKNAETKATTET